MKSITALSTDSTPNGGVRLGPSFGLATIRGGGRLAALVHSKIVTDGVVARATWQIRDMTGGWIDLSATDVRNQIREVPLPWAAYAFGDAAVRLTMQLTGATTCVEDTTSAEYVYGS